MNLSVGLKPSLSSRRKLYELLILLGANIVLYFVFDSLIPLMLFNLGFIWNWAASQPVAYVLDNKRYKFSLLRMVYNLHTLVQLPFQKLPTAFSILPKILPAGFFWMLVIRFAGSQVPFWPTFVGSLFFELTQIDTYFVKTEVLPEIPQDPQV